METPPPSVQIDPQDQWAGIDRIVALGDLHGDYDRYREALDAAGLVDARGDWCAGMTHFVQIGDIPDRGPDSAKIINHLQQLEQQARACQGQVHVLIGNHEVMNIQGNLLYVHPGEYDALRKTTARPARATEGTAEGADKSTGILPSLYRYAGLRSARQSEPAGYAEHREHWHVNGKFGAWVASHNTVIRLNRLLFVHAGISPAYLDWSIRDINLRVREELRHPARHDELVIEDPYGPHWYRGLALEDEAVASFFVNKLLQIFDVDHVVVGHTPACETIVPRYGGRVLVIDSGISRFYGGPVTSLLVEGGRLYNLQGGEQGKPGKPGIPGKQLEIPVGDHCQEDLLTYFRDAARLVPSSVSVREKISELEGRESQNS